MTPLPIELLAVAAGGVRAFAATLLIVAGIGKYGDRGAFERILAGYRILPERALPAVATTLPGLELAAASLLNLLPPFGSILAAGLLASFAGAVAINLLRGRREVACGCGTGGTIGWPLVAGNVALAAALLVASALPPLPALLPSLAGLVLGVGAWAVWRTAATVAAMPAARSSFKGNLS